MFMLGVGAAAVIVAVVIAVSGSSRVGDRTATRRKSTTSSGDGADGYTGSFGHGTNCGGDGDGGCGGD